MARPLSVLVCDDDPLLLDLLEFKLAARGYAVARAADGAEALDKIDNLDPDLVVLDAMMPVVDGFEVLRRVRREERHRDLPIVMLTARKQERDILDALELGASDYLVKPFIPEELVARLSRLAAQGSRR